MLITRSLARLRLSDALTCAGLVGEEYEGWPRDCSTIMVVSGVDRELLEAIVRLRNSGFTVTVIVIANPEGFARVQGGLEAEGVRVMHVGSEADLSAIGL